jgi:acyl-CoA dehydrogenase
MNFELNEEFRMLQALVAHFVNDELMPLETALLQQDMNGYGGELSTDALLPLNNKCRELGLWGLDVPEQFGGANLPALAMVGVNEEVGRSAVPFHFPPDSPNLHMLISSVTEAQREKYLLPYSRGETISAIGISEPGAGADPAAMSTRAELDGDQWVLNGRKIWISKMDTADFTIVMAKTDTA